MCSYVPRDVAIYNGGCSGNGVISFSFQYETYSIKHIFLRVPKNTLLSYFGAVGKSILLLLQLGLG